MRPHSTAGTAELFSSGLHIDIFHEAAGAPGRFLLKDVATERHAPSMSLDLAIELFPSSDRVHVFRFVTKC